ncbi:MAG: tRNA (N6-threonylcarbamoyladenosine(37)-N6)-methyltransferase TrmO [Methanobacterium sp.]
MKIEPIGIINSPYKIKASSPHQGRFSKELSKITIFDEYKDALHDIDRYKHYFIIYLLDRVKDYKLKVIPHGNKAERGLFSTRAPVRPNPIGLCLVELVEIGENVLTVKWLDALDGSPLLDIKPFWPEVDCIDKLNDEI